MARPFQTPYEPEFEKLSSPSTNSSGTPFARSETPVSFKPNVNRAKTKRWVEAKKYSYDGNDWGGDEYGEYDDDEPLPLPQASSFSQSTNDLSKVVPQSSARPALPSMDRSRSMDHVATLGVGPAGSRSRSVEGNVAQAPAGSAASDKPLPFVRPAEIYKRMQESQRQDNPHHFARSQTEPMSQPPPPSDDPGLRETQGTRSHENEHSHDNRAAAPIVPFKSEDDTPSLEFPNTKRLPGSDANLIASDTNAHGQNAGAGPQENHDLQHNPSLGFRSVVHQAFDVPETPSTTVDSVVRSNSDGTSVISLVVGNRGPDEDKTPTIVEEPSEISTPRDTQNPNLVFKPGHRRDISLPSPNNSPSRRPVVTSPETTAPAMLGEMSSETPTDSTPSFPRPLSPRASSPLPPAPYLPAPLSVSTTQTRDSSSVQQPGIPVVIPSISAENSPQDTESDRLRKEIIQSLSRENTPGAEPQPQGPEFRPQATRQDTEISQQDSLIPSEYERYWNEQAESSPQELRPPIPGYNPAENASQDLYSSSPMITPAAAPASKSDSPPKLKRRFSWETSSSDGEVPAMDLQSMSPSIVPVPGQFPATHDNTAELAPVAPVSDEQEVALDRDQPVDHQVTPEKPKLTIVPPAAMDDSSIASDGHLPEVAMRQSIEAPRSPAPVFKVSASVEPTLLGFRTILGIKSSDERVRAFDRTRDQFATIDTGLQNWLQVVVRAHPEHMDVVEQSVKASSVGPKAVATNRKFPKLSSLGHFASHQDGPSSGSGHARRPSAPLGAIMNKQQVEQRGKEFLHTAGALGGRAGEAAKGLFAKGRNKLKGGGTDKGFHRVRGYRREIRLSDFEIPTAIDDPESEDRMNQRHTVHFGSLPNLNLGFSEVRHVCRDREPQPSDRQGRVSAGRTNLVTTVQTPDPQEWQLTRCVNRKPVSGNRRVQSALNLPLSPSEPRIRYRDDDRASRSETYLVHPPGTGILPELAELAETGASIRAQPRVICRKARECDADDDHDEEEEEDNKRRGPVEILEVDQPKAEQATAKPPNPRNGAMNGDPLTRLSNDLIISIVNVDSSEVEAPPPESARAVLLRDSRGVSLSPRIAAVPAGAPQAYLRPQPSADLARPSSSAASRSPDMNSTGQTPPDPSTMRSFATDSPSPPANRNPAIPRRWFARPGRAQSRSSGDEAEMVPARSRPHSRGLSRSSVSPGRPVTPGVSTDSNSPQTRFNTASSRHEFSLDLNVAATTTTAAAAAAAPRGSSPKLMIPSPPRGRSAMGKLKIFKRSRGASLSDEMVSKDDASRRGSFNRLGGWFNRSRDQQGQAASKEATSQSSVAQTMEWLRPVSSHPALGHARFHSDDQGGRRRSNVENHPFFQGQRPPPEGYFAPESFSCFRESPDGSKKLQHLGASLLPDYKCDARLAVPDRLPSPTGSFTHTEHLSPQLSPPLQRHQHHQHYHQQQEQPLSPDQLSPNLPSPAPRTPPSRGRSISRAYAQDLKFRSRSPKAFPPRPEEASFPSTDTSDPAHNLGTFRSNPRTSRIGDQELPWKLTLPGDGEDGTSTITARGAWLEAATKRALQSARLPTYAEDGAVHAHSAPVLDEKIDRNMNRNQDRNRNPSQGQEPTQTCPQNPELMQCPNDAQWGRYHPHRGEARAINAATAPVELPVRVDDDSADEIKMSSTAYPGQEWRPLGLSGWEF